MDPFQCLSCFQLFPTVCVPSCNSLPLASPWLWKTPHFVSSPHCYLCIRFLSRHLLIFTTSKCWGSCSWLKAFGTPLWKISSGLIALNTSIKKYHILITDEFHPYETLSDPTWHLPNMAPGTKMTSVSLQYWFPCSFSKPELIFFAFLACTSVSLISCQYVIQPAPSNSTPCQT